MKRRLSRAVALAVLATSVVAGLAWGAAKTDKTVIRAGNLILTLDGELTPSSFPRDAFAPAAFRASADLETADGAQPPALRGETFDVDKDIRVDVHGLPACGLDRLVAQDTAHASAACGPAILGRGKARIRVAFPEQAPFYATGPLILFNGGVRGGVTTAYFYSYVNVPIPTAVIAPMQIAPVNDGSYGNHYVISVPAIAGGHGSVVHVELNVNRLFDVGGERRSALMVRCSRGRILARGSFEFRDGSLLSGNIARACEGT